jgi:hypothetical protein
MRERKKLKKEKNRFRPKGPFICQALIYWQDLIGGGV